MATLQEDHHRHRDHKRTRKIFFHMVHQYAEWKTAISSHHIGAGAQETPTGQIEKKRADDLELDQSAIKRAERINRTKSPQAAMESTQTSGRGPPFDTEDTVRFGTEQKAVKEPPNSGVRFSSRSGQKLRSRKWFKLRSLLASSGW